MQREEVLRLAEADEYLNYTLERLKTGQGSEMSRWANLPARALVDHRLESFVSNTVHPVFELTDDAHSDMQSIVADWYQGRPDPDANAGFNESIMVADGARPVGLIRNDRIESLAGDGPFVSLLQRCASAIVTASRSVGRIERDLAAEFLWADKWYAGTGCYLGNGLVLTNRHVLQDLTSKRRFRSTTSRKLPADSYINFDGQLISVEEGRSIVGQNRFRLKSVVWTPDTPIPAARRILHELDIAILSIELPADRSSLPRKLHVNFHDPVKDDTVAVIGFPGRDNNFSADYSADDVIQSQNAEQIVTHFVNRGFGFKRISAGRVMGTHLAPIWNPSGKSLQHDCSTLSGNSGSPMFRLDPDNPQRELEVVGCHFFGAGRRYNVAHSAGAVRASLDEAQHAINILAS